MAGARVAQIPVRNDMSLQPSSIVASCLWLVAADWQTLLKRRRHRGNREDHHGGKSVMLTGASKYRRMPRRRLSATATQAVAPLRRAAIAGKLWRNDLLSLSPAAWRRWEI